MFPAYILIYSAWRAVFRKGLETQRRFAKRSEDMLWKNMILLQGNSRQGTESQDLELRNRITGLAQSQLHHGFGRGPRVSLSGCLFRARLLSKCLAIVTCIDQCLLWIRTRTPHGTALLQSNWTDRLSSVNHRLEAPRAFTFGLLSVMLKWQHWRQGLAVRFGTI